MSGPPTFTDPDGDSLTVTACDGGDEPGRVHLAIGGGFVCAGHGDFPPLVAALFEAAGKPAPLILDRPDHPRSSLELAGATFSVRPGGVEEFRVHGGTQSGVLHEPGVIRRIAACLAVLADEAEAGPDPAEVEELAELIRTELYPLSERIGLRPSEADRTAARAALRWTRDKQQRGGGS